MFHIIVLKGRFMYVISNRTCTTGKTLMLRQENGLERKKKSLFYLWEDVGILQGKLKIEWRGDKWTK